MSDWHEGYRRRYARLKEAGVPFFPDVLFKDAVMALLVFAALVYLSLKFGASLEDLADPTDTTYNPRPEWYFLFLFQALKLFPGKLEAVAAILLPGIGLALLMLVPFLDRGAARHPFDRPFWSGLGLAALGTIIYLSIQGWRSPLTNPVVEKDPQVLAGQRLYRQLNCEYCHRIGNKGGDVGPALDKVVGGETEEWLERHFRNPREVTKGSAMPKLNLLDEEIKDLTAYMLSLGAGAPYSEAAPKLFADNCAACHKIGKEGADVGPDLSLIGTVRDKTYIRKYLDDPSKLNSSSAMPGFKGQLTDIQLEDLSRYVAAQGR